MGKTIAIATPVFFALIALEYLVGRARGRSNYRLNDAVNSLSLGVMSQVVGLFTKLLASASTPRCTRSRRCGSCRPSSGGCGCSRSSSYDFCYYWNHRLGHESAVFWAAHVVHHQSQEYNLSTALRQTSSGALLGWIFYLPMAIAGIPPEVFVVAAVVNLLYQYWIHTEQVGSLGWFDRWFGSPSNHRVHHAVNDRYIDRNYGGITMLWDRLFGTFVEESERACTARARPLDSWDPLWANFEVYADLARKSRARPRWRDKLAVWLMPPGWQPALAGGPGLAQACVRREPRAALRPAAGPCGAGIRRSCISSRCCVGATALLWYADQLPFAMLAVAALAVLGVLWLIGAVMQGRLATRPRVAAECVGGAAAVRRPRGRCCYR